MEVTREDLAGRIEISPQQLHKYESGQNRITVSRLIELCDALGVDLGAILATTQEAPAQLDEEADVLRLLTHFCALRSRASRDKILELAEFLAAFERREQQ
jgi:transcriptional regulator with XRE-family HTH domain